MSRRDDRHARALAVVSFSLAITAASLGALARAEEQGRSAARSPGQGESCLAPPHACVPEATLDCVRLPDRSVCGTNHVWLNVAHNRLSLPLASGATACDARFDDLNVAKWTCQSIAACRGITRDHGVTCDGVVKLYELRRGVLWDTTPDDAYQSWVRRDFEQRADTDLADALPDGAADPCQYRFEDLDAAKAACSLTQGCHGVVEDAGVPCGGTRKTFDLRSGGQIDARGSRAWIYRVRPAAE